VLTPEDIKELFRALDADLNQRGAQARIVIVGGAAVSLLLGERQATKDVDSIRVVTADKGTFLSAVANVSTMFGLSTDWLNERAAAFAMGVLEGKELWKGTSLSVSAAGVEQLVAMKISALRDDIDFNDACRLLRTMAGEREEVWNRIAPFLLPGMDEWKRQNFDALWELAHAPE
jgi:hypothetical protein